MSNGVYALLGVLLGGLVTAGVSWWQSWRAARMEWQVVSRLITDELEQMMTDLAGFVSLSRIPAGFRDDLLSSALWEEHRALVARGIKNDAKGDEFWRGLSRLYAQVRAFGGGSELRRPAPKSPIGSATMCGDTWRLRQLPMRQ
jgi:hypothetical protein